MDIHEFIAPLLETGDGIWVVALAIGCLVALYGTYTATTEKNFAAERLAGTRSSRKDGNIIHDAAAEFTGLAAAVSPQDEEKRSQIHRELIRAGFRNRHAVRNFFLVRTALSIVLPGIFLGLLAVANMSSNPLPVGVSGWLLGLSQVKVMLGLTGLAFFGYVAPGIWLDGRISARKTAIEQAFPNGLDLLQISVEAGLGFDAAMMRVAHELETVAPELSEELRIAQADVQAGRERGAALMAMARRVDIDIVNSFANVVMQSVQFGTSMSEALNTYAKEMRIFRELKAQEKANQLPVKMSAVLAALMLPAIVTICLGPVVIRYIRYFG